MKPFNLEEYLKNPSRKVVTRDGRNVRIVCTDKKGRYPVVALVEYDDNSERVFGFSIDGICFIGLTDNKDLFFATEKREGWVNLYRGNLDYIYAGCVYTSKDEAYEHNGDKEHCIATVKIEWEE